MHIRSLATFISLGLLAITVIAAQETFLSPDSPRILYDNSWTSVDDSPNFKSSVNGSLYYLYGGGNLTVHYAPPKEGKMYMWINGTDYLDLKAAATTAPQSPLDPSLKATHVQLRIGAYQIHIGGSSNSTLDAFKFGGFNVVIHEGAEWRMNLGLPQYSNVEIIDNTAFTYSDGWEVAPQAPFSYNSTLMRTRTKGASVSYTFQKPHLKSWVYGAIIDNQRSLVQAILPYHSGQVNSALSRVFFPASDTLVQTMLIAHYDWGTAGTYYNFTLDGEGTLAIDFIAVMYGEPPTPTPLAVKIVVPAVVTGLVVVIVYFLVRTKKRKSVEQQYDPSRRESAARKSLRVIARP